MTMPTTCPRPSEVQEQSRLETQLEVAALQVSEQPNRLRDDARRLAVMLASTRRVPTRRRRMPHRP